MTAAAFTGYVGEMLGIEAEDLAAAGLTHKSPKNARSKRKSPRFNAVGASGLRGSHLPFDLGKSMKIAVTSIVIVVLLSLISLAQNPAEPPRAASPAQPTAAAAEPAAPSALPAKVGKMLTFEVLIADLLESIDSPTAANILELERAGKLGFLTRLQLTSLEEQTASVQFGELISRVTGRSTTGFQAFGRGGPGGPGGAVGPQSTPIYSSINVGTIVQMTARVQDDGSIVAQLYVERSGLAGGPETAFDPTAATPPKSVERLMTETTMQLKPGEAQVIGGRQNILGKDANKTWIVVT